MISFSGVARRGFDILAGLGMLALTACTAAPPGGQAIDPGEAHLFARVYDDVSDYYVEPRTAREAALPAIGKLSALDPALRLSVEKNEVLLLTDTELLARFPRPADRDAAGWGELTAAAIAAARLHSSSIAALSGDELEHALLAGMTTTLDRFSRYLTPDAAREEHAQRDGFEGIGVTIGAETDEVKIVAVVPEGPADHAGIKVGDRLVALDDVATASMTRDEVVKRLRGPSGSAVGLVLARAGAAEPVHVSLSRAYVVVPTVTARRDGAIAVLRVSGFNEQTTASLRHAYQALVKEAPPPLRGIVLDLRGNPGGRLDQAISVAELFMPSGRIVSMVGRIADSNQDFDAMHSDITGGLPMVVLVNGGSASSAEIVAAALQDSGRALTAGSASYGKGTVQMVLHLPNEGELILTWARLVAPGGYLLHQHGIVPALCTAGIGDDEGAGAAIITRGLSRDSAPPVRRASLDDAGWQRLRELCPSERVDHRREIEAAERVLADPALFARLRDAMPAAVAARTAPGATTQ